MTANVILGKQASSLNELFGHETTAMLNLFETRLQLELSKLNPNQMSKISRTMKTETCQMSRGNAHQTHEVAKKLSPENSSRRLQASTLAGYMEIYFRCVLLFLRVQEKKSSVTARSDFLSALVYVNGDWCRGPLLILLFSSGKIDVVLESQIFQQNFPLLLDAQNHDLDFSFSLVSMRTPGVYRKNQAVSVVFSDSVRLLAKCFFLLKVSSGRVSMNARLSICRLIEDARLVSKIKPASVFKLMSGYDGSSHYQRKLNTVDVSQVEKALSSEIKRRRLASMSSNSWREDFIFYAIKQKFLKQFWKLENPNDWQKLHYRVKLTRVLEKASRASSGLTSSVSTIECVCFFAAVDDQDMLAFIFECMKRGIFKQAELDAYSLRNQERWKHTKPPRDPFCPLFTALAYKNFDAAFLIAEYMEVSGPLLYHLSPDLLNKYQVDYELEVFRNTEEMEKILTKLRKQLLNRAK